MEIREEGRGGSGYGIWLGWSWSGVYGEGLLAEYRRGRRLGHFGKTSVRLERQV